MPDIKLNFHAVGDGEADDTAAFRAADSSVEPVYVPEGDYAVTAIPRGRYYGPGRIIMPDEAPIYLDETLPQYVNAPQFGGTEDGPGTDPVRRLNTSVGQNAGTHLTVGSSGSMVAVGHNAASNLQGISYRLTAVGAGAAHFAGIMTRMDVYGTDACYGSTYGDRSTYIGNNAGKWTGCADVIQRQHDFFDGVESPSLYGIDSRWAAVRSTLIGATDDPLNEATDTEHNARNVGVGRNTLLHGVRVADNTAVGYNAMAHAYVSSGNTAIGRSALRDAVNVTDGVAIGHRAAEQVASAPGLVVVGAGAARQITHMSNTIAIGWNAMENVQDTALSAPGTGSGTPRANIAIGTNAMRNAVATTGENLRFNVAVGQQALMGAAGFGNVGVGTSALTASTGNHNTSVGHEAGSTQTSGAGNTYIGSQATGTTTGENQTSIGRLATCIASNQVTLGNGDVTSYRMFAASWTPPSDIRDKTDVRDSPVGLEFIKRLRPVDYRYDYRERYAGGQVPDGTHKNPNLEQGLIAQEVKAVADEMGLEVAAVVDSDPNQLALGYTSLIAPLIKAVQELSAEVEDLKRQLAEKE